MDDSNSDVFTHPMAFRIASRRTSERVRVAAHDALPLLIHAALTDRAWLDDFADETLDISHDLYEVLLGYQRLQSDARPRRAA